MRTLCGVVLQQPLDTNDSTLGTWPQQTKLSYQQSWESLSEMAAVVLDVEPNLVPENSICKLKRYRAQLQTD